MSSQAQDDPKTGRIIPFGYLQPGAGERLEKLLEDPSTFIVDVRYKPESRYLKWRRGGPMGLETRYGDYDVRPGGRYRYLGHALGNAAYKKRGKVLLAHPAYGIRVLHSMVAMGLSPIVLCACREYDTCHVKDIVRMLIEYDPTIVVEFASGVTTPSILPKASSDLTGDGANL